MTPRAQPFESRVLSPLFESRAGFGYNPALAGA